MYIDLPKTTYNEITCILNVINFIPIYVYPNPSEYIYLRIIRIKSEYLSVHYLQT